MGLIFRAIALCSAGAALMLWSGACGDNSGTQTSMSGGVGGNASGSSSQSTGAGVGGDIFTGSGTVGVGAGSSSGGGGMANCGNKLDAIVRDFSVSHPDFEDFLGVDSGIVLFDLGADGKPQYAGNPSTPTTSGKDNFDQWFRDIPGTNISIPIQIELTPVGGGMYTYDNSAFFPIDGQGFGDEGNVHNYHFTLEMHTEFEYKGGEVFTFTGDDDLFTYINKKLAINLGGVHGAMSQTVDLDAMAGQLGIVKGNKYTLDFFFAERHTSESNFRIDTTIGCFTPVPPPS